jgi:hypothetical protein
MLDRPIDQSDIDNRTLFRTRGGETARVVERLDDGEWPHCYWKVEYSYNAPIPRVTDNGYWHAYESMAFEHDLISRIPTEPKMESQVVVEDRRTGAEDEWKCIDELTSKTIFECKGDTRHDVYLKIYGGHSICLTNKASYHDATDWLVRPLTHLRLRMILEPKPA